MKALSVASHVANGYVGNRSTVTALARMNVPTDEIHTVHFASMYVHRGALATADELREIFAGLEQTICYPTGSGHVGQAFDGEIDLSCLAEAYDRLLIGYVGRKDNLEIVMHHIRRFKSENNVLICDPCMGDRGRLYVDPAVLPVYIANMGLADVVTPNQWELFWLTEGSADAPVTDDTFTEADTIRRCKKLHALGARNVFVTSVATDSDDKVRSYWFNGKELLVATYPKLDCYLGGCGDLVCALLAREDLRSINGAKAASIMRRVLGVMQGAIKMGVDRKWTSVVVPEIDLEHAGHVEITESLF